MKKKISILAVISIFFIILGFLASPCYWRLKIFFENQGYTRINILGYFLVNFPWYIAAFLSLLSLILIRRKPEKQKSHVLPSWCLFISLSFIIILAPPLPQTIDTTMIEKDKTFQGHSSDLKKTKIIPTLTSPIVDHNNIIWCSSFQLAWNALKDNEVKEPILLSKNQPLADLLNQAKQSKQDLDKSQYYIKTGWIKNNLIETIQQDMQNKFPDEAVSDFNDITTETELMVYSFLSANVRFKIPYFENDKELIFTDSQGQKTSISSFGLRGKDSGRLFKLRRQLNILFKKCDSEHNLTECAIDLCKDSSPNQIVLAMVKPKQTLLETLSYIDQQHKNAPKDKHWQELGPNDVLLVPNLFWKITHNFSELEEEVLQNSRLTGKYIEKAMQEIQFRLDRSGAELKSTSRLCLASGPTDFIFNRPFLIYIKNRKAKYPFFAMWVDNAELLEKHNSHPSPQSP